MILHVLALYRAGLRASRSAIVLARVQGYALCKQVCPLINSLRGCGLATWVFCSFVGSHCGHGVADRDVFWEKHIATTCIHVRIDAHASPPHNQ